MVGCHGAESHSLTRGLLVKLFCMLIVYKAALKLWLVAVGLKVTHERVACYIVLNVD